MSFVKHAGGSGFNAGHFLVDDENCTRVTRMIDSAGTTEYSDGTLVKRAGAVYNDDNGDPIGFVYEDTVVLADHPVPGSVVINGVVDLDKLGDDKPDAETVASLSSRGFTFIGEPGESPETGEPGESPEETN